MRLSLLAGLSALCAPAIAQTTFTSPIQHATTEGASSTFSTHFAWYAASRTQYLDGNQRGTPRPGINRLELRRDGPTGAGTYPARTVNVGIAMSHCDATVTPSSTFASNYIGAPTQVFTVKPVNLPDLSASAGTPAPWAPVFPFDVTFSYNGTQDLLYEITGNTNSSPSTSYPLDAVTGNATSGGGTGTFRYNGVTGCTVPPNTSRFDIWTFNPQTDANSVVTVRWYADDGPISSPGALALGLSDPNIAGLFCAPIRTSAEIMVPVMTDANGDLFSSANPLSLSFGYPGINFTLYSQFVTIEASTLNVYLSDAAAHDIIAYTPPLTLNLWRVQNTTSDTAATGSAPSRSLVLVSRFTH